jgi:alpha-1,2-mannosyltransferase
MGQTIAARATAIERLVERRDVRLIVGLLGLAALAFAIRFGSVAFKGGLDSRISLDEGTYFAGAIAFVNGRIPYRDFSLLHPPGLLYVLTPFAQLGTMTTEMSGLVVARLAFMLLGGVNTILVGLVGARINRMTGLAAAALYAVWVLPLNVERSALLIAPQVTPMLVALLALTGRPAAELTSRRVAVAGVAIGITGVFQIWAAIPAIVILGWLLLQTRSRGRDGLRVAATFVVSGVTTAALLLVPMLLVAGPRMVQMIIFAQATRVHGLQTNIVARLRFLEGLEATPLGIAVHAVPVILLAVTAIALVLFVAWRVPAIRLWAAIAAGQIGVILVLPIFLEHYRGWPAPLMALCLGAVVARGVGRLPRPRRVIGSVAYAVVLLLFATITLGRPGGSPLGIGADTRPELLAARCVIADEGFVAIRTHTLVRSLRNGCRIVPNPRSFAQLFNATKGGRAVPKKAQADYQQYTLDYFKSADVLLLNQLGQDGLSDATLAALRAEFPSQTTIGKILELRRA